ncbi:MAG TPA: L,D-transpeptidase family protein [Pyrinomonadaceae bacterium]|nr:L,D-transpeptidase family protein [Pyrinomonadaceae bacterium]
MVFSQKLAAAVISAVVLVLSSNHSAALSKVKKREGGPLKRTELKEAERRLSRMGFSTGPVDGVVDSATQLALVTFQKWEGRKITGRLTRAEFNAIRDADLPRPKDPGYKHVEVDLDRQVLLLADDNGEVTRILPVSTGSGRRYKEKRMSGLAYTPRGRFRIYGKMLGWRRSPLGLLYYPNYFSDGLAIHGNPSVPHLPRSHGCVRIPMFAAREISEQLPVGTILLIYDAQSFVSAQEWAQADREKEAREIP